MVRIFSFSPFQELVLSISRASEESTEFIYSTVVKLQVWNYKLTLKYNTFFHHTCHLVAKLKFYSLFVHVSHVMVLLLSQTPFKSLAHSGSAILKVILILTSQLLSKSCQV